MNRWSVSVIPILWTISVLLNLTTDAQAHSQWKYLARGIEYGLFPIKQTTLIEEGEIHIVRIDPTQAELKLILASEQGRKSRTAGEWCEEFNLAVAINAGMYGKDLLTNVGYLKNGSYIQNGHLNSKYKSVFAFGPKIKGLSPTIIIDLDEPNAMKLLGDYNVVIQNLRLMKSNGVNVWGMSERKWSEAAIGMDNQGRVLFLFCQSPLTMREFNEAVNALGLGVTRMMHVEGGPIASLSINTKEFSLDLTGNNGIPVNTNDRKEVQFPIPNIIGVQVK